MIPVMAMMEGKPSMCQFVLGVLCVNSLDPHGSPAGNSSHFKDRETKAPRDEVTFLRSLKLRQPSGPASDQCWGYTASSMPLTPGL